MRLNVYTVISNEQYYKFQIIMSKEDFETQMQDNEKEAKYMYMSMACLLGAERGYQVTCSTCGLGSGRLDPV